jgi:GNAT superfamily N-acetyltransferase
MSKAVAVIGRFWRAEADDAVAVAQAMRLDGNDAAAVETLGDGALVALGPGRYVNRAIGVGPDLEDGHIEVIERFFSHRGSRASVQLTSWASDATLDRLAARGFRPQWFRSAFAAALSGPDGSPQPNSIAVVDVDDRNLDEWLEVLADGNEITTAGDRIISDEFGRAAHRTPGAANLLAIVDGRAVGCGSLRVASGVGLLGAAATRPGHRGSGVQSALLRHRMRLAADMGCDLIAATALPAGASARNLLRHGLHLVDTQLVMTAEGEAC